jgi:hypothetical protein
MQFALILNLLSRLRLMFHLNPILISMQLVSSVWPLILNGESFRVFDTWELKRKLFAFFRKLVLSMEQEDDGYLFQNLIGQQ